MWPLRCALLVLCLDYSTPLNNDGIVSRRQLVASGLVASGAWSANPELSSAARGAAELDFEFYMRDLVGGNKKEGNIQASAPPTLAPPRQLNGPLPSLLLNNDCTPSCLAVQALLQQLKKTTGKSEDTLAREIQNRVEEYRQKSSRSFRARAPWQTEDISDQYFFDFTSYALWRTAADMLPDYVERNNFVRNMGKMIYERLLSDKLIQPVSVKSNDVLVSTTPSALEILTVFKSSGFCKDYRIRGDDTKDPSDPVFDELDNESLLAGGTTDCLVSVFEPATLGASLQITGEQSRFAPEFVGTTIAAMWETAAIRSAYVTFFVDPEYRPNPKDYFPNEQLIQYTLSKI